MIELLVEKELKEGYARVIKSIQASHKRRESRRIRNRKLLKNILAKRGR